MNFTYDTDNKIAIVRLSRRNLQSLMAKLNDFPEDSFCTIQKVCEDDTLLSVVAEENDLHYQTRIPGAMHPETESQIMENQ